MSRIFCKERFVPRMAFVAMLIFAGCTFEPDENFVRVDPSPQVLLRGSKLQAMDLMTMPDTFELFARTTYLRASFAFENNALASVRVLVDEKPSGSAASDSVEFSIYAPEFSDGYHKIRLEGTTNSGTGSLADNAGNEILKWSREWTFRVQRIPPPTINITKAAPEDGRLVIEWEPNEFKTEKVIQIELIRPSIATVKWSYLITDPEQTRLVDTLFVDAGLKVTLTNQSIDPVLSSPATTASAEFDAPNVIETSSDGRGNLTLKWNRSLFYKNVGKYSIDYDGKVVRNNSGVDTVLTTDQIPFWGMKTIVFRTIAKTLVRAFQDTVKIRATKNIEVGQTIGHSMRDAVYSQVNPALGFGVDNAGKTIYVLEGGQLIRTFTNDSLSGVSKSRMAVSNDGEYLYLAYNGRIIRVSRSGVTSIALDTRLVYGSAIKIGNLSLGDRYICFDDKPLFSAQDVTSRVFDLQTNQHIATIDDTDYYYNLPNYIRQSSDGKYVVLHDSYDINIYEIGNGIVTLKKRLDFSNQPMNSFFDSGMDGRIVTVSAYRLIIYDIESDAYTELPIGGSTTNYSIEVTHDPVRGLVGYKLSGFFYVIDPTTATILRRIPIEKYTAVFSLYDGSLYNSSWKYDLKLD